MKTSPVCRLFLLNFLLCFFSLTGGHPLSAQPPQLWMKSVDEGVFLNLFQDSQGYIWMGAWRNGLKRYDGQTFRHYQPHPGVADSLHGAWIFAIEEDAGGDLWIGSDQGLHRFDRKYGRFENFPLDPSLFGPDPAYQKAVFWLHLDRSGGIWTANGGLHRWDPETMETEFLAPEDLDMCPVKLNAVLYGQFRKDVPAFAEDRNGYLWFGLEGDKGLYRYDPSSNTGKLFLHEPGNPKSLPDNTVWNLHIDREGTLWVGTAGGLCRYNSDAGEAFERFPREPGGSPEEPVYQVATDPEGRIWVIRPQSIELLNPIDGTFREYFRLDDYPLLPDGKIPPDLSMPSFRFIGQGRDKMVWFSFTGAPFKVFGYNPETDKIDYYLIRAAEDRIRDVWRYAMIDRSGLLWISAQSGSGVYRQEPGKSRFQGLEWDREGERMYTMGRIPFCEDSDGRIWLGGIALSQYEPVTRTWSQRTLTENEPPLCLMEDHKGRLWIGTQNGVLKIDSSERRRSLANLALGRPVRASTTVRDQLYYVPAENAVDGDDRTWWSADFKDDQWLSVDLGEPVEITRVVLQLKQLLEGAAYAIQVSDDQFAWSTIFEGKVTSQLREEMDVRARGRYVRFLGRKRPFDNRLFGIAELEVYGVLPQYKRYRWAASEQDHYSEIVEDIHEDGEGNIWFATGKGIGLYDEEQDEITFFPPNPGETELNGFWQIAEDKMGKFWLSWQDRLQGVYVFDPATKKYTHHRHVPGDPDSLASNEIHGIFRDRAGDIWLGVNDQIQRFDPAEQRFVTHYTSDLTDPNIYPVYEDSQGRIWVSEYSNGLVVLDPERGKVMHLKKGDTAASPPEKRR